jgi:predicted deacylase
MMKLLRKQMLLCSILFLVFTLSACSAIGQTDENNLTDSATSAEKTVSVVRGTITPTVSTQTTIVPAVPFIISSPENGIFNTAVELEEKITAGQIIGTLNGKELEWWDAQSNTMRVCAGKYDIMVGRSSQDQDLQRGSFVIE